MNQQISAPQRFAALFAESMAIGRKPNGGMPASPGSSRGIGGGRARGGEAADGAAASRT